MRNRSVDRNTQVVARNSDVESCYRRSVVPAGTGRQGHRAGRPSRTRQPVYDQDIRATPSIRPASETGAPPSNLSINDTYLLYCTRMLAMISNLAHLYTRGATGDSIFRAASEVGMLAIAGLAHEATEGRCRETTPVTGFAIASLCSTSRQGRPVTWPSMRLGPIPLVK